MKKVLVVYGTRPEFIKLYPLIKELQKEELEVITLNTGQHKEMLDQLMSSFKMKSDYNLKIMDKCDGLVDILTKSLEGIDKVIKKESPDLILVHGDTSATLAGSIAGFYNKIKVGHVEAGLRTYDKYSPFPEEVNRQITGIIADFHFTPTERTKENLINEGKDKDSIFVVGNTAIDTLKYTINENYENDLMDWIGEDKLVLVTIHRRENLEVLEEMYEGINDLAKEYKDCKFLYPVHLNPIIQSMAKKKLKEDNIKLIDPLQTIDFHNLMNKAYLILTDSGGIQEEAPSLGKPVLVLRNITERPEGVEAGTLKLVGTNKFDIIKETKEILENRNLYKEMSNIKNPYGQGDTSKQIVKIIKKKLI